MLKSHMDAQEDALLARSRIAANIGHSLHKGTPREDFVKDFLRDHLSESVSIGSGEIIDASSKPNEQRNQIDIVIYKRDYPKLNFSPTINGFLAESVVATIEIKSTLDREGLRQSIKTAANTKKLKKNLVTSLHTGYQPPSILNYVVAYDGPVQMTTVYNWIDPVHQELNIKYPIMGATGGERMKIASPSVDAIFVLGKGFIHFDNTPLGFMTDQMRLQNPSWKWVVANGDQGNLLLLFLLLTAAVSSISVSRLDPIPYIKGFEFTWG